MPSHSRCSAKVSLFAGAFTGVARPCAARGSSAWPCPRAARPPTGDSRRTGSRAPAPSSASTVVVTRSKRKRSWVTSTTAPGNSSRLSSSTSSVGMSRSLVGSSRTSRSAGCEHQARQVDARLFAAGQAADRHRRAARSGRESDAPTPATWIGRPAKTTWSPCGARARRSVSDGSSAVRCWSSSADAQAVGALDAAACPARARR